MNCTIRKHQFFREQRSWIPIAILLFKRSFGLLLALFTILQGPLLAQSDFSGTRIGDTNPNWDHDYLLINKNRGSEASGLKAYNGLHAWSLVNTGFYLEFNYDFGSGQTETGGTAIRFSNGGGINLRDLSFKNFSSGNPVNFTGQMLNLYGDDYGIGIQSSTQYYRTNANFAWYIGGSHNDAALDNGGGTTLMSLGSTGNLTVSGDGGFNTTSIDPGYQLHVQGAARFTRINVKDPTNASGAGTYIVGQINNNAGQLRLGTNDFQFDKINIDAGGDSYFNAAGNVGIGLTNPQHKLHVDGDALVSEDLSVTGDLTVVGSFDVAAINGAAFVVGTENSFFFGPNAGKNYSATTRGQNLFIGKNAGEKNTAGYGSVALGYNALQRDQTGWRNIAIGGWALNELNRLEGTYAKGDYNTAIGYDAGRHAYATSYSTYIGSDAGRADKFGYLNTFIGANTAERLGDASSSRSQSQKNTVIGANAWLSAQRGSGNVLIGSEIARNAGNIDNELWIDNSSTSTPLIWGDFAAEEVKVNGTFHADAPAAHDHALIASGHVHIGTHDGGHTFMSSAGATPSSGNPQGMDDVLLTVEEGIATENMTYIFAEDWDDWPDYVFEDSYHLASLAEVDTYIKEHKHLPGVISQEEVKVNGVSDKQMNITLLTKVEELTLYTIEQQKELEEQKALNTTLTQRLEALEAKLQKLLANKK